MTEVEHVQQLHEEASPAKILRKKDGSPMVCRNEQNL